MDLKPRIRVPIKDQSFAHSPGITVHHRPTYIEWIREGFCDSKTVFFTDRCIGIANTFKADKKVALLIEPTQIYDVGHKVVRDRLDDFTWVLTYDRNLQKLNPEKILYYPIGGCWIPAPDQRINHKKTGLISMIASGKRYTPAHELRHEIAKTFKEIAAFGHGYKPVEFKTEGLAPYQFSIAVENAAVDDLFTEKLIDCFLTGTVPIYYGTSNIKDHFNMGGVLQFRSIEELRHIIDKLTTHSYDAMLPAIADNFQRALKYRAPEDWLFEHYPFLFQ